MLGWSRLVRPFSNMLSFSALEQMNQHLERHKYPYLLVYFSAKWNPLCKVADSHVNELRLTYPHVAIVTVNSDATPQISKYYLVRAEPEFIFCRHGDEVIRQVGVNKEGLFDKTNRLVGEGEKEEWQPYGTNFEQFYKQGSSGKRWWWFW